MLAISWQLKSLIKTITTIFLNNRKDCMGCLIMVHN